MKVKVFVCPKCQSGVFPRTTKDFRTCACSAMGVAGPTDAPRISAGSALGPKIKVVDLVLKASAATLEDDWTNMTDEFGFIPKGEARLKNPRMLKADEISHYMGSKEDVKPELSPGEGEEGDDEPETEGEGGPVEDSDDVEESDEESSEA